jgi:membrane-associated phospholipid phosphatase
MNFRKFFKTNASFFGPYILLLLAAGVWQILYRQGIVSLWVNRQNTAWADAFFYYVTYLGDGRFCVAVGLLVLAWKRRQGALILASFVFSGLLSQLIKTQFFPEEPRPAQYFAKTLQYLHQVEGVELHLWNSFPSGHTTSAFALWALVAFWVKNPILKFVCLVLAVAVAYSRMYLLQHFLIDVYVGSLLGTTVAVFFYAKFSENHD